MCLHATYVCYLSLSFLFCSFTRLKVSVDDHPLDKETELFGNNGNHVKLLIEKSFLTSSTYSESLSTILINLTMRIFLMWPQMILPPNLM